MKTKLFILSLAAMAWSAAANATEAPGAKTAEMRVGVYDSRVVAFAHFWSEAGTKERETLVAAAKAASNTGDAVSSKELEAQLRAAQTRSHLQVFSSAPAEEAMMALKDKLPAIQQELGVARFVSKWDEVALKDIPAANRVDASDRLVREFNPDAKRLKTIEQMKASKPLPLDEATKLEQAGKL